MRLAPLLYRVGARMLFAPFGGLDKLRRDALATLPLTEGSRVLELGCGPGALTSAMVRRGARVHAVDQSPEMLRLAARRAPSASFEQADLRSFTPSERFDVVLCAFVLHELIIEDIPTLLERAVASLSATGVLAVMDHAVPANGANWRRVLHAVESPTIERWLAFDLQAEFRRLNLVTITERQLAGGRVVWVVAQPP